MRNIHLCLQPYLARKCSYALQKCEFVISYFGTAVNQNRAGNESYFPIIIIILSQISCYLTGISADGQHWALVLYFQGKTHPEGTRKRASALLENLVYGCYVHLRIVHQTVGPAWMNHCMYCPGNRFSNVIIRHQHASPTQRIDPGGQTVRPLATTRVRLTPCV